jgi:hypothetical protein
MAVVAHSVAAATKTVSQRVDCNDIRGSFARCQAHAAQCMRSGTSFDDRRGFD